MTFDKTTPLIPAESHYSLPDAYRALVLYKDVEQRIAILINLLPADQRAKVLKTAAVRAETGPL